MAPFPAVLSAAPIAFTAADPGGTRRAPAFGIRNTERVGVLIHKIVFPVSGVVGNAYPTSLQVDLRHGIEPLTNGLVPLAGISYPPNRAIEMNYAGTIALARPIYLAPAEELQIAIGNALFPATAATIIPTAIGVQVAAPPPEMWLPYLTAYLGPSYLINSGAAISDQSNPNDLGNPFDAPIFVERMIGRVLEGLAAAGSFWDDEPDAPWGTFLARISDSAGRDWVSDPTPLPTVCSPIDRSWRLGVEMAPKSFLSVEFEGTSSVAAGGGGLTQARAILGLMAYRRIAR